MTVTPQLAYAGILAFTLLALLGMVVTGYTTWDCQRDLGAAKKSGIDGYLLLTGVIARRSSMTSVFVHLIFFILGLIGLFGPSPSPDRVLRSLIFSAGFSVMMVAIVVGQIQTQIDRHRLRRQLAPLDPTDWRSTPPT